MSVIIKYHIHREQPYQEYMKSVHGREALAGNPDSPLCVDCHGIHDIRPASEPRSHVHPANLRRTCGQANSHPGMPGKVASAKIHIGSDRKTSPVLFYIQRILLILVLILLAITILWFIPGFIRKRDLLKRRSS